MLRRPLVALAFAAAALSAVPAALPAAAPAKLVVVAEQGSLPRSARIGARDCLALPRVCVNGAGGVEIAYRLKGSLPAQPATATVLTDESCTPDRYGVSHCLNELRLADGRKLLLRHDHAMANDPCLAPGERVRVVGLKRYLR